MKFLNERREIANAINIWQYPVITMDISKPIRGDEFYHGCFEGSKVVLATPSQRYPDSADRCTAEMYRDHDGNVDLEDTPWLYKRIVLREGMVGIAASFGLSDVREMVEWNNAPHVKTGDLVVVFFDRGDRGWLRLMKVDGHRLVDLEE